MNFASIRWRLPASYAAVALVAALALGSLMLLVLNEYYARQERDFLMSNATGARLVVEQALQGQAPAQTLQAQVRDLAFLSQVQIRVLAGGQVLADSGMPAANPVVSLSGGAQGMVVWTASATMPLTETGVFTDGAYLAGGALVTRGAPLPDPGLLGPDLPPGLSTGAAGAVPATGAAGRAPAAVMVNASPFGYGLATAPTSAVARSAQRVQVPLLSQPGTLEISHGPAYGAEILRAVALAWLLASLVAVALAALAGMAASRQFTQPVLALTAAARRMQWGDLSSRVALGGRPPQEFLALAQTFNQMAQQVDGTVSTLRAFVSDAAHELNTPLTALHTNLELAQHAAEGAERAVYLDRAAAQGLRLERLAGDLLDLSRLEAAPAAHPLEPLDLARLVAERAEAFASRAEQAERSFTLVLPAAPVPVAGQAGQLQRLLDNLLENALKFTPPGGSLRLSVAGDGPRACLTVADTGIGIPAEDLPHLFERFHRGRNSAAYPGTGLGLAIVKAIVNVHGGQVAAHSAGPGQGTEVRVWLDLFTEGAGPKRLAAARRAPAAPALGA